MNLSQESPILPNQSQPAEITEKDAGVDKFDWRGWGEEEQKTSLGEVLTAEMLLAKYPQLGIRFWQRDIMDNLAKPTDKEIYVKANRKAVVQLTVDPNKYSDGMTPEEIARLKSMLEQQIEQAKSQKITLFLSFD